MRDNPIQFAVVREDPALERALIDEHGVTQALLVASGGCTALSLLVERPDVALTAFDMNPAQLALVKDKLDALQLDDDARRRRFNVGTDDPAGLSARGNFESLFRGLRRLLEDLSVGGEELARAFEDRDALGPTIARLIESRYWPIAFDLFVSDPILHAMFGPAATQHAPPGSYPRYFQAAFERGLARDDAFDNRWLHHVLLGRYVARDAALPSFLRHPAPKAAPELVEGTLDAVRELDRFGLISLSNVTDWMGPGEITALARVLDGARPGALALFRQLNNQSDLGRLLGDAWEPLDDVGARLHAMDRSLFYERVRVYRRTPWTR